MRNATESVSISVLCLDYFVFLVLFIPSGSYDLSASSSRVPEGKGLMKAFCLGPSLRGFESLEMGLPVRTTDLCLLLPTVQGKLLEHELPQNV